ncbi:MAG: hypothetical protein NW203_15145 [Hyphomonadaceae bacterium]|nr:hypothetical protein [Hyphomonadaceae bacterium]
MPYDPAKDIFATHASDSAGPARNAAAVTPSDSTDLPAYAKALYVGTAGALVVVPVGASTDAGVTFANCPVGWLPVQARRVLATGTTAGQIVALIG